MCKERQPTGKQTWTPSRNLRRPQRQTEWVDDALTLAAPPGAVILERDQLDNSWGSFVYIKYLLPRRPDSGRSSRRKRPPNGARRA